MTKYIFITGGVVSSLGKGIAAASLGLILKSRGLKVVNQKFDPYLNIDPGTMNPYQHGEVFVTDDGAETDLDLGHYERFTDESLSQSSNTTAGRVYLSILNKEREGGFHGGTVQVIPNVTDEIRRRMLLSAQETGANVIITEIGGTVGDIESLPFIEAIRQIKYEVGVENCAYIHLTLLPYMKKAQELKSKPTQHSVKELQGLGIQPDIIMLRSEVPIDAATREKLALFCNVETDSIIQNLNAKSIYEVPLMMEKEGLGKAVCKALSIEDTPTHLEDWAQMVDRLYHPAKSVTIALVGKYVELRDAYLSVVESLLHGGIFSNAEVNIDWIDAETLCDEKTAAERLGQADGIIVPGGFGDRGIEGMIRAAQYARTHNVPYFGICLGMQIQVIEFARHVLGLKDANSTEMNKDTPAPVIDLMPDQNGVILGGTLRLGKYECALKAGSTAAAAYKAETIWERHRHRYEFNNAYRAQFEHSTLRLTGVNPERNLIEIVEQEGHPWMVGVQFHPEFKSRPNRPQPLFREFIKVAAAYAESAGTAAAGKGGASDSAERYRKGGTK
ncbi:CTP synthase [Treponema brennaborense]|uniref:CTP synthase n=1 Tax=Treponema brennaborense (strain DSM 12168 / CIP 105900 / DD5/3) TaxID=906968 RepID=F4LKD3_TREBD|nr:CTP synthase [Treponema brennaborense DSM 12168]